MEYRIRPLLPQDIPQANDMRRDPRVAATLTALPTERLEQTISLLGGGEGKDHIFAAVGSGETLLGIGHLQAETLPRYNHKASLGLLVAPAAQGQGIGRALLEKLIDLADKWLLLERLELTVFANNLRALRLYRSLGFQEEALARRSVIAGGSYQDEIDMGRLRPGFIPSGPEGDWPLPPRIPDPSLALSIRPLRREDTPAIARIEISHGVFENTVSLPSARERDFEKWYAGLDPYLEHSLVAEGAEEGCGSGQILGLVNLHLSPKPRLRHKGDVGIMLAPESQGLGVGRRLMAAMVAVADDWMALERLELVVFARNSRARALYRSMGFEEEGVLVASAKGSGAYLDEVLMGRLRSGEN